jgi:hypothetical protein
MFPDLLQLLNNYVKDRDFFNAFSLSYFNTMVSNLILFVSGLHGSCQGAKYLTSLQHPQHGINQPHLQVVNLKFSPLAFSSKRPGVVSVLITKSRMEKLKSGASEPSCMSLNPSCATH